MISSQQASTGVDFQSKTVELTKQKNNTHSNIQNKNKGEFFQNSDQSPTLMLPELAKTYGSSHLTIFRESKKPSSKEEQIFLKNSITDDFVGRGYRKSARSIQKSNETGRPRDIKETLNMDANSLHSEIIASQINSITQSSKVKPNLLANVKMSDVSTQKKTVEFTTDDKLRQQQLIMHGLHRQPPHLYQMASPIPFSSTYQSSILNIDRFIGQPAKGTLKKGIPQNIQKQLEIAQCAPKQNINISIGFKSANQAPSMPPQSMSQVMEQRNSQIINKNQNQYHNLTNFQQLPKASQNNTVSFKQHEHLKSASPEKMAIKQRIDSQIFESSQIPTIRMQSSSPLKTDGTRSHGHSVQIRQQNAK